jgi:hypothetical protein
MEPSILRAAATVSEAAATALDGIERDLRTAEQASGSHIDVAGVMDALDGVIDAIGEICA